MRRMMLLTSVTMVFSLVSATVVSAGTGATAGNGSNDAGTVMARTHERSQDQLQEPACQVDRSAIECEAAQTRTQTRQEVHVQEHDGECMGTDSECEADQARIQVRDRDQIRSNDGQCAATNVECEAVQARSQAREEAQKRVQDGECKGADSECEADQERIHVRDRDQIRSNDGECAATDAECVQHRTSRRAEIQEQTVRRLDALADDIGGGEYLRVLVRWMYTRMYGPISALFT